ncbi:MAG TPA: hypothetical protein VH302_16090 [Bryobacteraceae bacterium]|jgi:hypothetical protein|nr:hypothetical protein [Bryobacteraceae bacterium]
MGFALWMDADNGIAWVQGTHEYRPLGTAALSYLGQFRRGDFRRDLRRPRELDANFVGFFGSLETVNEFLHEKNASAFRRTPAHLL